MKEGDTLIVPNVSLAVKGFIHTPENPGWAFERLPDGAVALKLRGSMVPILFDRQHFEAFLTDALDVPP